MLNDLLDIGVMLAGYALAGAALFTGIFLAAAGYYFITDLLNKENN